MSLSLGEGEASLLGLVRVKLFLPHFRGWVWDRASTHVQGRRTSPRNYKHSGVALANQTKERSVHELFTGAFRNKSSMWIVLVFLRKTPEFTKMGEIHELFVLALSLVWFAGATPETWRKTNSNFLRLSEVWEVP